MPLAKGHSPEIVRSNIKEMIKSGYKPKQAVAASLANARKFKKMADGGMVEMSNSPVSSPNTPVDPNRWKKFQSSMPHMMSDGGQVVSDGGMDDMPRAEMGPGGKDESMSEMDDKGPEDYLRSLNEIREDGEYYPSEVANPNEMDEAQGFAQALRRKAMSQMSPENYAMGGLVQDGPAGDEPVGTKPSEGDEKDSGMDSTIREDNEPPMMRPDGLEHKKMEDPSGEGLSKEALEAIRMKKKSRMYGSYVPR